MDDKTLRTLALSMTRIITTKIGNQMELTFPSLVKMCEGMSEEQLTGVRLGWEMATAFIDQMDFQAAVRIEEIDATAKVGTALD